MAELMRPLEFMRLTLGLNLPEELVIITHGGYQPGLSLARSFSGKHMMCCVWLFITKMCTDTFAYGECGSEEPINDELRKFISFMHQSSASPPPPYYNSMWEYHMEADYRFVTRCVNESLIMREDSTKAATEAMARGGLEIVEPSQFNNEECAICLSSADTKLVRMPCLHIFHEECMVTWLKKNGYLVRKE